MVLVLDKCTGSLSIGSHVDDILMPWILHVWAVANSMGAAIVTTFESVWVISFSITASFDVSESIIEMIWVSAWEFTTAISYNLKHFNQIQKIGSGRCVQCLNDWILTSVSGSCRRPPSRPPGWWRAQFNGASNPPHLAWWRIFHSPSASARS